MQEAELGEAIIHTSEDWHLEVLDGGLTAGDTCAECWTRTRTLDHWYHLKKYLEDF